MFKKIYKIFTEHPNSVNETYLQHMWQAIKFSVKLEWLAFCVFIHAIFPFWNEFTASDGIKKLNDFMQKRRKKAVGCSHCNRNDGTCGCGKKPYDCMKNRRKNGQK
tara:strand:- start:2695 stop:3012 length:318 start_codon:yes stop_codon:yes gene_type:complete